MTVEALDLRRVPEPAAWKGTRDLGLDVIRVLAVTIVAAVIHASSISGLKMDDRVYNVLMAFSLGLLMSISGYLTALYHPDLTSRAVRRQFLVKRLARLYPLYAAALTVFCLLWYRDQSFSWVAAQYALVGVLFYRGLGPPTATLYWVQILFVFYALYLGVCTLRSRAARLLIVAAAGGAMVLMCVVLGLSDVRLALYAPAFVFGVAVARFPELPRQNGVVLVGSALAAAVVSVSLLVVPMRVALEYALRIALTILAFLPAWWLATRVARIVPAPVLRMCAYSSFAAYLFHRPLFSVLMRLVRTPSGWPTAILLGTAGTVLAFAAGWAIQSGYDRGSRMVRARSASDGP